MASMQRQLASAMPMEGLHVESTESGLAGHQEAASPLDGGGRAKDPFRQTD